MPTRSRTQPRRKTRTSTALLGAALACALLLTAGGVAHAASLITIETPLAKIELASPVGVELPAVPPIEVGSIAGSEPIAKVEVGNQPQTQPPGESTPTTPVTITTTTPVTTPTTPTTTITAEAPASSTGSEAVAHTATTTSSSSVAAKAAPDTAGSAESSATAPVAVGRSPSGKRSKRTSKRAPRAGHRSAPGSSATARPGAVVPTPGSTATKSHRRSPRANGSHTRLAGRSSNPLDTLGRHLPVPLPVPDWSKPIILLLLLLVLALGVRTRLTSRRARRLEGQRVGLLHDLDAMQAALVPVIPDRLAGAAVSVAYRPADGPAAGGDFYDAFALDDDRVALILGDVAGHGHEALSQAALTRYTLRAYLQAGLEPRVALAVAGTVLADPYAAHFATVVVAVHEVSTARLTYASAGHPPPLAVGFAVPEPPTVCCSPPVGWDVPTGRRQTTLTIPAGAAMCFFSDGLIEARTADGLLGRQRLDEIVTGLGARIDAVALIERVRASVQSTPDDMVACVLAPQGRSAVPAAQVEELEVDVETLSHEHVHRFLEHCGVPAPEAATATARARQIADATGTALLRIELAAAGASTLTVLPGLGAPAVTPGAGHALSASL
jgi:hypothetical protein